VAIARVPSGEIFLYNQALEEMLGHPILSDTADTYNRYGGVDAGGRPLGAEAYPLYRAIAFGETVINDEMLYRRPDGRVITLLGQAAPILDDDGKAEIAIVALQDISGRKQAEAHQRLLINELSHRAKNLLAIIQSVAQQSFRGDDPTAAQLSRFEGRLGALSAAHGILTRERWEAVPLRRLICDTFTAVRSDDERLDLDGPDLMLPPKVAVSLAMAIHELATNALKYGSLSTETGKVTIRWSTEDERLKVQWKEQGGPLVSAPTSRGFGTRMIERGLAAELGGEVRIHYEPDGVRCEVDAPMPTYG
jgi:two-component sensor histidine kinase